MSRLERLYAPPEIGAPGRRAAVGVRRDLILAGLFVLTMAAVVVGALALILPGVFGGNIRLHAYFPDADGLDAGIHVSQAGYVIGVVETVEPVFPAGPGSEPCPPPDPAAPTTQAQAGGPCFRALLRVHAGWPIPRDSIAQIASAGLLQGDTLRILPGRDRAHPLADGDAIKVGQRQADLVTQLGRLTDSLQGLVEDTIAPALKGIAQQIEALKGLLGTGEAGGNQERLAGVFDNLKRLSADLDAALDPGQLTRILGSVEAVSENLAGATETLGDRSQDIHQAVQRYGDLAADLRALVKRNRPAVDRSITDAQFLLQELSASLAPILEHVETATRNLAELSRDLRSNPAVIIRGREVQDNARRQK